MALRALIALPPGVTDPVLLDAFNRLALARLLAISSDASTTTSFQSINEIVATFFIREDQAVDVLEFLHLRHVTHVETLIYEHTCKYQSLLHVST